MRAKRTAILISGRGSNMRSLIEATSQTDFPASIALVISNKPDAAGLIYAQEAGITTKVVDHRDFEDRQAFEQALHSELLNADIELVCLAGFMRLLGEDFVNSWRDRMLNIHPSLLPAFKGLDTHERAIAAGVRIAGCTVHFVRAKMDDGPIIAQGAVPVLPDDTPDALAARVLAVEHDIYPKALALVASGKVRVSGEKALVPAESRETDKMIAI